MYTYLGLQNFIADLQAPLAADEVTPSLRPDKYARLCSALSNDTHTYLALEAPTYFEIVKAKCFAGVITFDRGQDGTSAQPFPMGACVRFIMAGAAVKDLINETLTCPQPCTPATIAAGGTAPDGVVGVPYSHRIVISGTPPFQLGAYQIPDWMEITLDAGEIRLTGTPPAAGVYNVAIPLKSCGEIRAFFIGCVLVADQAVPPPT